MTHAGTHPTDEYIQCMWNIMTGFIIHTYVEQCVLVHRDECS